MPDHDPSALTTLALLAFVIWAFYVGRKSMKLYMDLMALMLGAGTAYVFFTTSGTIKDHLYLDGLCVGAGTTFVLAYLAYRFDTQYIWVKKPEVLPPEQNPDWFKVNH